jgi:hypothetical protein
MEADGQVAILIVRVQLADPGPGFRARVTWLTDIDDPRTRTVTRSRSRNEVERLVGHWLDAIGVADGTGGPAL